MKGRVELQCQDARQTLLFPIRVTELCAPSFVHRVLFALFFFIVHPTIVVPRAPVYFAQPTRLTQPSSTEAAPAAPAPPTTNPVRASRSRRAEINERPHEATSPGSLKMVEYAKMKNAELEALLKSRGLPTGGKKADMVERLTKDDEKVEAPAAPVASKTVHPEDEIDWDDDGDEAPAASAKDAPAPAPAVEKAATTTAVEGKANSQADPNQKADVEPSQTNDLSVKTPGKETKASSDAKAEDKEEPAPDYTRGLAATNLDEEIEKRKARAKKFGLNIEDDEGLKKLERAKKFGETGPPKGLDEALPERTRKRGRDDNEDVGRNKRRGGGKFSSRRGGGGRGNRDGDRRRDNRDTRRDDNRGKANNGFPGWMSDADRAKAEARKNKFSS